MKPPHQNEKAREKENDTPLAIKFDVAEYEQFLEDSEMTDAQKREYLQVIWNIIVQFVDMGFGVHPVQQACGKRKDISPKAALTAPKRLYSNHPILLDDFKNADAAKRSNLIPAIHTERKETP